MVASADTVTRLLEALHGVKRSGKGWAALCPGHEDHQSSLSITQGDDGKVLLNCFAGCEVAHVVEAMGLTLADLFENPSANGSAPSTAQVNGDRPKRSARGKNTRFEIKTTEGDVIAVHMRMDYPDRPKTMWWELPDGSKDLGDLKTPAMPLYGSEYLPSLVDGSLVVVTEGETATEALRSVGTPAVGTVTGASAIPNDESLTPLVRLRVVLWPDNDDAGQKHMTRIAARLKALGCPGVRLLDWAEAPTKGDAANALEMNVAIHQLIADATEWGPTIVDVAQLLNEVAAFYRRFVVLTVEQAYLLALWTLHSHTIEAAETTAYVNVTSAEKESGKTRTKEVAHLLVANPLSAESISPAALARSIDMGITLLLDEIDTIFKKGNGAASESVDMLRGVLDSGWRRGGQYVRMVGQGANMVPYGFSTFGAKMLVGIGEIPGTLGSRSIPIVLRRRRRDKEPIERFRIRKVTPEANALRARLEDWASANVDELKNSEPDVPEVLNDRMADSWEPLIAIADLAGSQWPQRARNAAIVLSGGSVAEDESTGVRLLADLRPFLGDRPRTTADLLGHLNNLEESSWGTWNDGKGMNSHNLAKSLRPFGIKPGTVRLDNGTKKGYSPADFEDAFNRYLPCDGNETVTPSHEPTDGVTRPPLLGVVTVTSQARASHSCDGVTDRPSQQTVTEPLEVLEL